MLKIKQKYNNKKMTVSIVIIQKTTKKARLNKLASLE